MVEILALTPEGKELEAMHPRKQVRPSGRT
jgi:hypothetical protein